LNEIPSDVIKDMIAELELKEDELELGTSDTEQDQGLDANEALDDLELSFALGDSRFK
jgi:hypothetical protein